MTLRDWFGQASCCAGGMVRIAAFACAALSLVACNMGGPKADINNETKFSQAEYEVKASPRVTEKKEVRKGGGRYQVGKPYKIRGKWYEPKEDPEYAATGQASWYGPNFHGRLTANGEIYDQYALSAAHPTMPLPSYARVTNLDNGRSVMVRVNDRGPFAHGRIIDLSARAAEMLDYRSAGVADVKVEYVGKARMDGKDQRFLMASYRAPVGEGIVPGATMPGTMLAMNDPEPSEPLERAITEQIETVLVAAAGVPVPMPRPGLFAGGVPLDVVGQEQFQVASLQPLGYVAPVRDPVALRMAAAFGALQNQIPEDNRFQNAAQAVNILVGVFGNHETAENARNRLSDIGLISLRGTNATGKYELRLVVGGDVAGAVLLALRARGFENAQRLP